MKKPGTFAFTLGDVQGRIRVIEYRRPNYTEVSAAEARRLIENVKPLLLDVRTRGEYNRGHIPDSRLIPLQEIQARWKELRESRNQDILIYCATGNRSTVASKILIDRGFKRIYNLRRGIKDWSERKHPVVRGSAAAPSP